MAKAIIWCRVSTTAQEFESQKKELIKRALSDGFKQKDLIEIGEAGASAIKMNDLYQKEVNQLTDAINNIDEVKTIYVWEVSRLARNELAFYQMKDLIMKNKIQFICNVPQIKLLDDNGEVNHGQEVILNLLVTLAKQEMEIKEKRFKKGRKRRAEEGKWSGGKLSYGYTVDQERDKLIVINPEEAENVREVYNLYEQGMSQLDISVELRNRGQSRMTLHMVHNILNNERYTGKKMVHQGTYERAFPPIISEEQFKKCREIANGNNYSLSKARNIYYGDHLIKCTECGRYCNAQRVLYHCYDAFNRLRLNDGGNYNTPQCTNRTSMSINIMDSLLWFVTIKLEAFYISEIAQKDKTEYINKIKLLNDKINATAEPLEKFKLRKKRILNTYLKGDLTDEEYDNYNVQIEDEKNDILKQKVSYENEIAYLETLIHDIEDRYGFDTKNEISGTFEYISQLEDRIAAVTDDQQRSDLVHKHIEKVTYEPTLLDYGSKQVEARLIRIFPKRGGELKYYFYGYNGKGGTYLEEDSKGRITEKEIPYLNRFQDKAKIEKRAKVKEKRINEKESLYPHNKFIYGLEELGEKLGISATRANYYIRKPSAKSSVHKFGHDVVIDAVALFSILAEECQNPEVAKRAKEQLDKLNNTQDGEDSRNN